jgi:hypothetical protein
VNRILQIFSWSSSALDLSRFGNPRDDIVLWHRLHAIPSISSISVHGVPACTYCHDPKTAPSYMLLRIPSFLNFELKENRKKET